MSVLPVQHCTNPANVSVSLESDLAGLPTQTYPDGTTIWARSSQVLFCWDSLSSAGTVAGTSVAVITGGAWIAIGSVSSSLGPFNTVSAVTLGSRLLDVSASQITALKAGTLVWVLSVKDYWRWDPLSTLTADNITVCNPTANGANPGRFVRALFPAPEWMRQATWFIDGSNTSTTASDENDGLTVATALLTDIERNRRMGGPKAQWILVEYHLRYVSDIDFVNLEGDLIGTTANGCNVFAHGSATNGQGQTTLYTGTIDALTAQVEATNTPYQITSNALPVSWTASALIVSATNINARIRVTSNTIGAKAWAVFDQGAKQARWTNDYNASTYTTPYTTGTTSTALVNGSTFVVETLTQIKSFQCGLVGRGNLVAATSLANGIFVAESLVLGRRGAALGLCIPQGSCLCVYDGCALFAPQAGNIVGPITVTGSWVSTTAVSGNTTLIQAQAWQFIAGGSDASITWNGNQISSSFVAANHFRNNFMFQNARLLIMQGICQVSSIAVFDPPAVSQVGIQCMNTGFLSFIAAGGGLTAGKLWGGGTVRAPTASVLINNPARVNYSDASTLTLLGSIVDIQFDSRGTQIPAFDTTTGLFTAPRTTSFANLVATVAAGGFGGTILDPASGSYFGTN